jgi:transcriptional regulator with XRE-family HTH domain
LSSCWEAAKCRPFPGGNVLREAQSPIDLANDLRLYRREPQCSQAELASQLNLSPTSVSRALSIRRLAPDLHIHVENFSVCAAVAYIIASLSKLDDQRKVMAKAINEKLSRDAVQRLADALKRDTKTGKRPKAMVLQGRLNGRAIKLTLTPGETTESVIAWLKEAASSLARHKDLPAAGRACLFAPPS